ncbi:MAG: hypothetical protein R2699_09155 [Acidimicrobiales bacterium]
MSIIIGMAPVAGRMPPPLQKVCGSLAMALRSSYRLMPHLPVSSSRRGVHPQPGVVGLGTIGVEKRPSVEADGGVGRMHDVASDWVKRSPRATHVHPQDLGVSECATR